MVYEGNQKLGDLFISRREKGKPGLPTLSVTLTDGLVNRETLERKTDTNLAESEHLLVKEGDIVYNMMRMWQGASGRAEKDGLVSPAYIVLAPTRNVDTLFASYLFKTQRLIYLFWAYSYGLTSDRLRLYFNDFSRIPVDVPRIEDQRKIAQILSTWDKAIATTEKLIENSKAQKKALMQQLLTGKKRIPGFEGKWKFSTFGELFKIANDKSKQIQKMDYKNTGICPIVDQGKKVIIAYTDSQDPYSNLPVIVFGDHTRIIKWIDFAFMPGADGTQLLKTTSILDLKLGYFLLSDLELPNLGYSRHMRELKEKEFKYPLCTDEQERIAAVLTTAEKEIEILQQKLGYLKQEKKSLMQQLLTGKRRAKVDG